MSENWRRKDFQISTDQKLLDSAVIHDFLARQSEWARGIPLSVLRRSLRNSLCFGVFNKTRQIGLARVISDYATIAYLGDVFILPEFRRRGLSKWLMECIMSHPSLQNLRRWILVTEDAHTLYKKYGFKQLENPDGFMELHNKDVYRPKYRKPAGSRS